MEHIYIKIRGIPYGQIKRRGRIDGPKEWNKAVIEQTRFLPRIQNSCVMNVTFLLPEDKFPLDFPFGPDLDNLLKRFCDALNETIFSETRGKDSCIVGLHVMKVRVKSHEEAGVILQIFPVTI